MITKNVKIKEMKYDGKENIELCDICCLDGLCLDSKIACYENTYYALVDENEEVFKYEFEIIDDEEEKE